MPLDVEYAEPQRFQVRASGEVTLTEIEAAIGKLVAHPDVQGADIIVDAREVAGLPSTPELRQVASDLRPMIDLGLGAIGIVTENPLVFGVARMFAVFAETAGATVGAFRCFDEAHSWLTENRRARPA